MRAILVKLSFSSTNLLLNKSQEVPWGHPNTHQACRSQDSVGCCSLSENLWSPLTPWAVHEENENCPFLAPRRKRSPRFQPTRHHMEMQLRQLWACMRGTPVGIWKERKETMPHILIFVLLQTLGIPTCIEEVKNLWVTILWHLIKTTNPLCRNKRACI